MGTKDKLLEELEVRKVLEIYTDAVNRRDWETYESLWVKEGAVWDLRPPIDIKKEGIQDIMTEVKRAVGAMEVFFQMTHSIVIDVEGDTATARVALNEIGKIPGDEKLMNILAIYDDELVRENGKWLFKKRVYTVKHLEGNPPME